MKHSFSVRCRLGVALLTLMAGPLGAMAPLRAHTQTVQASTEPASIADLVTEIDQSRARGDLSEALTEANRLIELVDRQRGHERLNIARFYFSGEQPQTSHQSN